MRRILIYIVFAWITVCGYAAEYQPFTYSAPATDFRSTSAYSAPTGSYSAGNARVGSTVSFSTISSSNFQTLNSEGGLCYNPASGLNKARKGRPREDEGGDGDNAIGEYDLHSPIGDIPWIFIAILIIVYFFRAKMCTGLNRGFVLVKSWLRPDQTKRPKS